MSLHIFFQSKKPGIVRVHKSLYQLDGITEMPTTIFLNLFNLLCNLLNIGEEVYILEILRLS